MTQIKRLLGKNMVCDEFKVSKFSFNKKPLLFSEGDINLPQIFPYVVRKKVFLKFNKFKKKIV